MVWSDDGIFSTLSLLEELPLEDLVLLLKTVYSAIEILHFAFIGFENPFDSLL